MSITKRAAQASHATTSQDDSHAPATKKIKSQHPSNGNHFELLLDGATLSKTLSAKVTNGLPSTAASKVDESKTLVTTNDSISANQAIDISSGEDEEEEEEDDEEDDDDDDEEEEEANGKHLANGHVEESTANGLSHEDVEMAETNEADELEEPSFGERLREHPGLINVPAQFPDPFSEPPHLPLTEFDALTPGHSFVVPLKQALKTNDKEMLESFFQRKDAQAVRNTIQRMPSPMIGQLISQISERIYKRPGRMGPLMIWIQHSLVAHGGYLATRPELLTKLKALNQVIRQRSQGLQPLLQLKGKLDLLNLQLELRKHARTQSRQHAAADDDQDLIYVEGDPETAWNEDDVDDVAQIEAAPKSRNNEDAGDMDDDSLEEADPEDEIDGLLDIEAEEEDDIDEDEDDSEEPSDSEEEGDESDEESESEQEITAPAPKTLNRKR